jgi:hypothetical protein
MNIEGQNLCEKTLDKSRELGILIFVVGFMKFA